MGGFLLGLLPSTGSGIKPNKNQAFQGAAVASFDAAKLLTNWLAPALPILATK